MSHEHRSLEFEARIAGDGTIAVPPGILQALGSHAQSQLNVRLTSAALSGKLHLSGVTEEELERIAALQLESREQVIDFLLSEGALATRSASGSRRGRRAS